MKLITTTTTNITAPAIAIRLRTSLRPASAHGLRPATSGPPGAAGSMCSRAATSAIQRHLTNPGRAAPAEPPAPDVGFTQLLDPELVDQDVPLRIPLVVPDALRQEVDLLR